MAQKIASEPELLPPRVLKGRQEAAVTTGAACAESPADLRALDSAAPARCKKSSKPPATRARTSKKKPQGSGVA
jgi:hypothetical protein